MELADPVLLHIHAHEVILIRGDPTKLPPSSSYYEVNLTRGDPTQASPTRPLLSSYQELYEVILSRGDPTQAFPTGLFYSGLF